MGRTRRSRNVERVEHIIVWAMTIPLVVAALMFGLDACAEDAPPERSPTEVCNVLAEDQAGVGRCLEFLED